jgi:hypothetical protein
MDSLYGKILNFIIIWFAFSNLILTNIAIAEHGIVKSYIKFIRLFIKEFIQTILSLLAFNKLMLIEYSP